MLSIQHLTKQYGDFKAVDDLSLTVEAGDIFGFIGHNGAGKTTTLRSVAGILAFEQGEITVDGFSIRLQPLEAKRIMAYIPDNPDLYEHLTAVQYLNFVSDIYGIDADARARQITAYGEAFQITDRLGDLIGSMSHGMKQKVAIIAALIHDPKLILMDEPFVGLDPIAAHTLKQIMHEKCAQGAAIFFSTHVLEVAEKLCNKIAVIKQGCLIASGDMESVKGNQSLEDIFLELTEHA